MDERRLPCRGQAEDRPTAADIDVWKIEYASYKGTVSIGICAVDNRMGAGDHKFLQLKAGQGVAYFLLFRYL